jgi:hypothetical protein
MNPFSLLAGSALWPKSNMGGAWNNSSLGSGIPLWKFVSNIYRLRQKEFVYSDADAGTVTGVLLAVFLLVNFCNSLK